MLEELEERRRTLIDALRSDHYRQHYGDLFGVQDKYALDHEQWGNCCIGVGIVVAQPSQQYKWIEMAKETYDPRGMDDHCKVEFGNVNQYEVFARYYGIPWSLGSHQVDNKFLQHLMQMNDEKKRDFKFIARFLEVIWFSGGNRGK